MLFKNSVCRSAAVTATAIKLVCNRHEVGFIPYESTDLVEKQQPLSTGQRLLFFWRRARDSNPRNGFGRLHDFQSCSFDRLGQLSVFIKLTGAYQQALCYYNQYNPKNQVVFFNLHFFYFSIYGFRFSKIFISRLFAVHIHILHMKIRRILCLNMLYCTKNLNRRKVYVPTKYSET